MRRGLNGAGDGLLFIIKINKNNNKNYPIGKAGQGKARQGKARQGWNRKHSKTNWHRTANTRRL